MHTKNEQELPAPLMALIALVQGLALLGLHQAIELKFWPHQSPPWLFSFYAIALAGPSMLLLGISTNKLKDWFSWIVPFSLLLGLCGFYIGRQATPIQHIRLDSVLWAMIPSLILAVFKAQIYLQQKIAGGEFSYANLFRWSWRNFLTLSLALLFAGAFWGVLMLWAGLFKTIKINWFYDLFTERWFYYPAIALAVGFGIIIFRRLTQVIDTITRLQQALMKYLLIILVFVAIIFLASLLFTGLDNLWKNGGSTLVLWMQALMLFFINAVYQDDADARPYHPYLHRFIALGVVLLPIYSLISFYGLSLRIHQYGWSVERCWGMLIWAFLAIFSCGYTLGVIKHRDNWLTLLSTINVRVGIVFMLTMIMVNSPLLDFRKITVHSQLARLDSGQISLDKLELSYFRRELARPGYEALQALEAKYAATNPTFASRLKNAYSGRGAEENLESREEFFTSLISKDKTTIPTELVNALYENSQSRYNYLKDFKGRYLIKLDANGDQQPEYLFIQDNNSWQEMNLYSLENGHWKSYDIRRDESSGQINQAFYQALSDEDISLDKPQWQDIKINGVLLRVR